MGPGVRPRSGPGLVWVWSGLRLIILLSTFQRLQYFLTWQLELSYELAYI